MKRYVSFFTKKRKGSTLFVTVPIFLVLGFYIALAFYYGFTEVTHDRAPKIETEIDEECYEFYCWFA